MGNLAIDNGRCILRISSLIGVGNFDKSQTDG